MISYFPKYFAQRSCLIYLIALVLVGLLWQNTMPWYWIVLGIIEVACFFGFSHSISKQWITTKKKTVVKRLFWITLVIRIVWIFIYYWITMTLWNTPWEQPVGTSMDSTGYFGEAAWLAGMIREHDISHYVTYITEGNHFSDMGYPVFLALWNLITNGSILLSRIPNAFFDACSVVFIYRLAKRNFGEQTARMAALFVLLMPTMIFYSGVTMKESLMVMLELWALERGDYFLHQKKVSWKDLLIMILIIGLTAMFRTVLAWVLGLAFLCGLVLSSEKMMSKGKRWSLFLLIGMAGLMVFGGFLMSQAEELMGTYEESEGNFEHRASRRGGNALVKDLSKAVFAPIIFTLPFPTMVDISYQQIQQIQNGGYYIKNVLSFFCLLAIIMLLLSKEWKQSTLSISFMLGYLVVLALSSFAQSGRFHQPVVPLELMFAAYAITHFQRKHVPYFSWFMVLELAICIGWNWFKLKGKGMI